MIITSLMPDEIVNGYIGRLMTLNITKNKAEFLSDLQKYFVPENPNVSVISLLANASNKSTLDILKSNTIVPYRRAAVQSDGFIADEFLNPKVNDASCFRTIRSGMVLCEDCMLADIAEFNFTYWKRFHQLPGVDWCPIHHTPLKITKKKFLNNAYQMPPNNFINKSVVICDYDEIAPTSNEVIYRYIELACYFLNIRAPVKARNIVDRLGAAAREKHHIHIRRVYHSERTTLTDFAKASCPYPWLKRLFPRINFPDQYGWFGAIDNCMSIMAKSESFALALALIFKSTDEAIEFMRSDLDINI